MKLHLLLVIVISNCWKLATAADNACPITVAFTPHCERLLLSKIRDARTEIQAAIYEFTKKDIADAFIERADHGVKITIKVDAHEAEYKYTADLLVRLQKAKITIQRITMPGDAKLHDKFLIIDGHCVLTGSYNWTKRATDENWENLLAIESTAIAAEYAAEWDRIKPTH